MKTLDWIQNGPGRNELNAMWPRLLAVVCHLMPQVPESVVREFDHNPHSTTTASTGETASALLAAKQIPTHPSGAPYFEFCTGCGVRWGHKHDCEVVAWHKERKSAQPAGATNLDNEAEQPCGQDANAWSPEKCLEREQQAAFLFNLKPGTTLRVDWPTSSDHGRTCEFVRELHRPHFGMQWVHEWTGIVRFVDGVEKAFGPCLVAAEAEAAIIHAAEGVTLEPGEYEVVSIATWDVEPNHTIGERFHIGSELGVRSSDAGYWWVIGEYDVLSKRTGVTAVRRVEAKAEEQTSHGRLGDAALIGISQATAAALHECAASHDPDSRLLGNIRAEDIARLCETHLVLLNRIRSSHEELEGTAEENAKLRGQLKAAERERDRKEGALADATVVYCADRDSLTKRAEAAEQEAATLRERVAQFEKQLVHDERVCESIISRRDKYHELLDEFVEALGGVELFGEHSSANDPWGRAIAYASNLTEKLSAYEVEAKLKLAAAWDSGRLVGKSDWSETVRGLPPGESPNPYREAAPEAKPVKCNAHILGLGDKIECQLEHPHSGRAHRNRNTMGGLVEWPNVESDPPADDSEVEREKGGGV